MSKKRKKPKTTGGGRYTPPNRGAQRSLSGSPAYEMGLAESSGTLPLPAGWQGMDDLSFDSRMPVEFNFGGAVGIVTMPLAFAEWLQSADLTDEFSALVTELQAREVHGDMFAMFLDGREAPVDVIGAVADFGEWMDAKYGVPGN